MIFDDTENKGSEKNQTIQEIGKSSKAPIRAKNRNQALLCHGCLLDRIGKVIIPRRLDRVAEMMQVRLDASVPWKGGWLVAFSAVWLFDKGCGTERRCNFSKKSLS
jgi:hypothetical protein